MIDTAMPQTVTIDGVEYDPATLSEEARSQIVNLRVTDQKIAEVEQHLAILKTARTAYARALADNLPERQVQ